MQQEQRPPHPPYCPSNRPILCYRCGEYGHYQSKCALPEGSPPCHHCSDSKDHYSKDCPKQRASFSSGSTPNKQDFTFPKINLITVNTIPQPSPAIHVVNPQQVGEPAGVLTRAQRAALGLSLPASPSPPSPLPQHVSSDEPFIGAKSRPTSMLSDINGAFLEAVAQLGAVFDDVQKENTIICVDTFNSTKKRMGVVIEEKNGSVWAHWKGASEVLLKQCTRYMDGEGNLFDLTKEKMEELEGIIVTFANSALRTLCFACRELAEHEAQVLRVKTAQPEIPDQNLICLAIVGIKDPLRPGVTDAVHRCQIAGIKVEIFLSTF
ncbi:hypothetical protein L7F22_015249 [Adiantum nelumboides]|nr:hypothetical protein [Adiantum nelumboides]